MTEHRYKPRLRTFKGGAILFGKMASVDCIIRNISETGAALEFKGQVDVPDDFKLLIKPELIKRECHVVWRSPGRLGVRFT
jgi:hypothetical protein